MSHNKWNTIQGLVCGKNGAVVRGTLQALIEHLLPNKDYAPTSDFVFAFLLNVRLFADLDGILHELVKCFIYEQNAKTENFRTVRRAISLRLTLQQSMSCFPGKSTKVCLQRAETFASVVRRVSGRFRQRSHDKQTQRAAESLLLGRRHFAGMSVVPASKAERQGQHYFNKLFYFSIDSVWITLVSCLSNCILGKVTRRRWSCLEAAALRSWRSDS